MKDDDFEWDDAKAETNWRKHGIRFETARAVFADAFAIDWADDRFPLAEARFSVVGAVEGRILAVAYAMRGERIRVVSARAASPAERRRYHDENRP